VAPGGNSAASSGNVTNQAVPTNAPYRQPDAVAPVVMPATVPGAVEAVKVEVNNGAV